MSEENPTQAEIEYLAGLDAVRTREACERTSPALARRVLQLQETIDRIKKAYGSHVDGDISCDEFYLCVGHFIDQLESTTSVSSYYSPSPKGQTP